MKLIKYILAAVRTRRYAGKSEAIEISNEQIVHLLTSVQKDNYMIEVYENEK